MINWTDKAEKGTDYWSGFSPEKGVIELRKTFHKQPHYAQILIVMKGKEDVTLSMNGKASMTTDELIEIGAIAQEVKELIYGDSI